VSGNNSTEQNGRPIQGPHRNRTARGIPNQQNWGIKDAPFLGGDGLVGH
jgi:hypothetical protein